MIWLIGGIAVVFMIAATSLAKCLFSRKKPMKVEAAPNGARPGQQKNHLQNIVEEPYEEAKFEDKTDVIQHVDHTQNLGSGRNDDEENNLKGAQRHTQDSFKGK